MKIYFAGVDRPSFLKELWKNGAKNILISYADFKNSFSALAKHLDNYSFNILLDSGAYSAFTRGIELDIDEYRQFIETWGHYFERYFNLDVIGDFEETWNNQDYLESYGLHPVPVLHYGEPIELLKLITRQYDFIGLGGMVPISPGNIDSWLDILFYSKNGQIRFPDINFHGLGLTTKWLIMKYPFYSVDSTKWLVGKKYNEVLDGPGKKKVNYQLQDKYKQNIEWHLELEMRANEISEYKSNPRLF